MDRVLFGDNQFFGVNHMSEEKARAQAMRFQDLQAVIDVLDAAYQEGIRTFMCTTHDRVAEICDHFRANAAKYPDYLFYPCMPYAHKYANAVTEHGMIDALRMFLPQDGAMGAMFKGGVALASKDIEHIMQLLVDAEMKMFHGLKTPVIFLQNVVTDLLLGLGMNECFRIFPDHVRNRYGAEPGFITMNVPRLLDVLESRASKTRSCAPTSTRSASACAAASSSTRRRLRRGASGRSPCRCWRRAPFAARGDRVRCAAAEDRIDRVRGFEPRRISGRPRR